MPASALRVRLVPAGADSVKWQLIARNGRAVATSADAYRAAPHALAALADVCAALPTLSPHFSHPHSSVMWDWAALDPAGVVVASGGRSYDRYGTCVSAYRRFVAMAATLPPPASGRTDL